MGLSLRELLLLQIRTTGDTAALTAAQGAINKTGLAAAQSSLKLFGLSHAFQTMGTALTRVGLVLTAGTIASIKFAKDFEHEMAIVRTQTDFTAEKFQRIEDAILNVATHSSRPIEELEEGLFDIFSTIDTNIPGAVGALKLLSHAAIAGNTDIRTSSRSAIAMLNSYGMGIGKLNKVLDIQFQLVRFGAGTYEEIASAIGLLLPSSVAAGQSLNTVAGVLAFLTRNGMSASEAVTSAGRAMDLITRPEIRENLIKTLGIDVVDQATGKFKQIDQIMFEMATKGGLAKMSEPKRAKIFEEIFGVGEIRANRFFKTAIPRFDELRGLIDKTAKAGGSMNRAYEIVADTFEVRWGKFLNTLKVIGIEFGMTLLPVLQDFIKLARDFLNWFRDLDPETKAFLARFIAISGIILLVSGTIMKLVGGFLGMISVMKLAGIGFAFVSGAGLAVLAVVALIAGAAVLLFQNWDQVAPKLKQWWGNIQQWAEDTWEKLQEVWNEIRDLIMPIVTDISNTIRTTLTDIFNFIVETWNSIVEWTSERWEKIKETVRTILDFIRGLWEQFGDNLMEQVKITWDFIKGQFEGVIKIIQGILDVFMGIVTLDWETFWTGIKEIASGIWKLITNAWQFLWKSFLNILDVAWDNIKQGVVKGGQAIINFFKELPGNILDFLKKLPGLLLEKGKEILEGLGKGLEQAWGAVKSWFAKLPGRILDFFKSVGSWLLDAGRRLAQGFLEGIKQALIPGIGGLFSKEELTGIIKGQLGIESPAKSMIPIGKDFAQGFLVGIANELPKIGEIFGSLTELLQDELAKKLPDIFEKAAKKLEASLAKISRSFDKLKAKIDTFKDAIRSGFGSFVDVVGGILGTITEETPLTKQGIQEFLATQVGNARAFADALRQLQQMGLSPRLLADIAARGPESLPFIQALLAGGKDLVQGLDQAYKDIQDVVGDTIQDMTNAAFGKKVLEMSNQIEKLKGKLSDLVKNIKAEAVERSMDRFIRALDQLSDRVLNLPAPSAGGSGSNGGATGSAGGNAGGGGGGGGGGKGNTYNVTVSGGGPSAKDIVRELEWARRTR